MMMCQAHPVTAAVAAVAAAAAASQGFV